VHIFAEKKLPASAPKPRRQKPSSSAMVIQVLAKAIAGVGKPLAVDLPRKAPASEESNALR
jgi:hypothetical protein